MGSALRPTGHGNGRQRAGIRFYPAGALLDGHARQRTRVAAKPGVERRREEPDRFGEVTRHRDREAVWTEHDKGHGRSVSTLCPGDGTIDASRKGLVGLGRGERRLEKEGWFLLARLWRAIC